MNENRKNTAFHISRAGVFLALPVLYLFFSWLLRDDLYAMRALSSVTSHFFIAVMAVGVMLVFVARELDLSVASICSLSCYLCYQLFEKGYSTLVCLLLPPVICIIIGCLFGLVITGLSIRSFCFTFVLGSFIMGYLYMGTGNKPLYFDMGAPLGTLSSFGKMIILILFLLFEIFLCRSAFGQGLYAIENRKKGDMLQRRHLKLYKIVALSGCAFLAGLSGVLYVDEFHMFQFSGVNFYFIQSVAAVLLGSLLYRNGKPRVMGTLYGFLIVETLNFAFSVISINYYDISGKIYYLNQIAIGMIIVLALIAHRFISGTWDERNMRCSSQQYSIH